MLLILLAGYLDRFQGSMVGGQVCSTKPGRFDRAKVGQYNPAHCFVRLGNIDLLRGSCYPNHTLCRRKLSYLCLTTHVVSNGVRIFGRREPTVLS